MMIIQEIFEKLETSHKPVARLYYKTGEVRLIVIGFKKGMILDQHKTHLPARILVMSGNVNYIQAGVETHLKAYEYIDIPVNIMHEVVANEDSICLLTQG